MKVTKYEHACLVAEELGQHLIIDPGTYAESMPVDLEEVVAVVITHQHPDHFDPSRLKSILANNPDLTVFAPQDVLDQLSDMVVKKEVAQPKVSHTAGSFALDFYGQDHATIYDIVPCMNVGVMVNKSLYYPGDSFTKPDASVKVLALPSGAPWMRIGEAMSFLKKLMPQAAFPTHNIFYSEAGLSLINHIVEPQATSLGVAWRFLQPGDSIEI